MHINAGQYVISNNSLVSEWKFANDTTRSCVQSSTTYRPSLIHQDGGINGKASIRFAENASGIKYMTFPTQSLTTATVTLVASQDLIDNVVRHFLSGDNNGSYVGGLWLGGTQSNIVGFGWESAAPSKVRQSNIEPIGWQVYTFRSDKMYLNGVETGYTFNQNITPIILNTLGGITWSGAITTHFLKGKIAEMFIYNYSVADSEIALQADSLIQEYLPVLSLGEDTSVCGASFVIKPAYGAYFNSYIWSNGQTTPELTITSNGTYWLQTTSFGKVQRDTITISGLSPKPQITPNTNLTLCFNRDTTVFKKLTNAPGVTYTWNNGSTDDSISVFSGSEVFLTAFDALSGCFVSSDTVLLTHKTKADFANAPACPGVDAVLLNLSSDLNGDTVNTWSWNFGDPTTNTDVSNDTNGVWNYANSGTYPVYLKVTTSDGCADSILKNLIVKPSATPNFNWQGLCYGKPTQFFDQSVPQSGTQVTGYQWNFGPGINTSFVNPAVTFDTANVYPVSLKIFTASGCNETIIRQVPVNKGVNASFNLADSVCANQNLNIIDQSQGVNDNITSWVWRFGGNTTVSGQSPSFAFQSTGNRIVRLSTVTAAGCVDSTQQNVFVKPAATANFVLAVNGGTPPFRPEVNNLTTTASAYEWYIDGSFFSSDFEPVFPTYADTGTYQISLIVENAAGCTSEIEKQFVVFTGDRTLQLIQTTCTTEGDFMKYAARVFNKGALEVNEITFGANTDYNSVIQEVWTGSLMPGQILDYPLKSSAKYFTSADFCCVRIENFNDTLKVQPPDNEICLPLTDQAWFSAAYPTPSTGIVSVDYILPFADKYSATLSEMDGKVIKNLFTNQSVGAGFGSFTTDISDLRAGMYLIRISYRDRFFSIKVIKR